MSPAATIERELKLGVWPGFEVPDLRGKLNGAAPTTPRRYRLEAVYFDTVDLRLLRRGVTVGFRRGEQPEETWTARLPEATPGVGTERREISLPGGPGKMPLLLEDVVRGWAFGAPLVAVARLKTRRQRTTLCGPAGDVVAMVDDDEVSIIQRARVAARFRELELELADGGSPKLLRRLVRRMESAGAQPVDQMPKLVRALGPMALAPWDLAEPSIPSHPTAADIIRAGLIGSAANLVDHMAAVVLDEGPEGVHQARVGIRRLRSDLRTARPLLDFRAVRQLRQELDWLMGLLGEVRDLDVLLARLGRDIASLDSTDRAGADAVLGQASEDRAEAYEALRQGLRTPRCAALLEETARVVAAPPFKARAANRPAAEVLPQLVRRPLRDLNRKVHKQQGERPDAEALHRVRIEVKRVRYATELAASVGGKKPRRAARRLARVQDVLGEHSDACTACARLGGLGQRTGSPGAWAAGLLGGLQLARAAECRKQFESVWADAAAGKRWRWAA